MEIQGEIKKILKKSLENLGIDFDDDFNLDHPQDLKNGDWTTNIAMQLAGKEGKNPREFAEQIRASIDKNLPANIEKVEVAGPGYVNFYLSKKFYIDFLNSGVSKSYSKCCFKKDNQKILLEHSSPNLFKPFHVGHLVNNSIGESLGRILKFAGNEVETISFPSDVSPGIAKTIWAIKDKKLNINNLTLNQIADSYVLGTEKYKELEEVKKEVDEININLYKKERNEDWNIYQKGRELSLEHFYEITKKLGSNFSDLIFESEAEEVGKKIVKDNIGKVFKESRGAIIFEGSKYGLFDNVYINSTGFGTYLAKDTGLLKIKFDKFEFDKSITVTDIEQKQHFQLVKKSAELINKEWSDKSLYLQHGRMSFVGKVKVSSRYGNVPLVIDVIKKLEEKILENNNELLKDEVEKIAISSLKYSILRASAGKNIVFDLEKSLDFSGDSGVYLQYAYVRANSILRKSKFVENSQELKKSGEISDLEKILYRFTEEIEKSLVDYSPHHIANYLYDLASEFNSFYAQTKILDESNSDYNYNLALTFAFAQTMKKGLYLLGIETVDKM